MKWSERSFNTVHFRPRPQIHVEDDQSLILIGTCWGNSQVTQRVFDVSLKYIQAARSDLEVTSPFEFLPHLTNEANALRVGALLANENIFRSENKAEYNTVIEFVALSFKDQQLSWVQSGYPNLFLKRKNLPIEALSVGADLSYEMNQLQDPLPSAGLGLEREIQLSSGSFRLQSEDQIIVLSRSLGLQNIHLDSEEVSLQSMSAQLAAQQPQLPYWLGLIQI